LAGLWVEPLVAITIPISNSNAKSAGRHHPTLTHLRASGRCSPLEPL
jgi:hypothetical protein